MGGCCLVYFAVTFFIFSQREDFGRWQMGALEWLAIFKWRGQMTLAVLLISSVLRNPKHLTACEERSTLNCLVEV